jgi:hypothetical protein
MEKLYNSLSEQGKYTKSFEDFQTQFGSKEGQEKLYGALESSGDYTKSFEDFSGQFFTSDIAKTNDSASADPAVESNQNDTGSQSGNGSLGWVDSAFKLIGYEEDFSNTKEENTFVEDFFGKNIVTDVVGDVIRAGQSGLTQSDMLDPSLEYFTKGKDISDEDLNKLVETGRALENAPMTEEMVSFQDEYAKIRQEAKDFVPGDDKGASGVASDAMAFFLGWSRNPSAMTQYSAQSLANMAKSAKDNLGEAVAGGAIFAGGAKLLQKYGGKYGKLASIPLSFVAGAMGTTSGIMETGFTTADLVQDQAISDGLSWQEMSNADRAGYYKKVANDENLFNEIKSKAIARGVTIGSIDAFTTLALGPAVKGVSGKVATSRVSGLTGLSKVGTSAVVETAGGMLSEVAGQAAAGQEFNTQEILMEGFADKTLTLGTAVNSLVKEGPSYSINGEKMNGNKFTNTLKLMDDEAYVKADIKINNSPVADKIVNNRRQNIATDQKVDSRISGVEDRANAIKLTQELKVLGKNAEGNKTKIVQTRAALEDISKMYANSEVDASVEQRKQAIADAVNNDFEASFNKNTTAGYQDIGVEAVIAETDNEYFQKIAEFTNRSVNEAAAAAKNSNGVFAGGGKVFINKAKAKRSIDIATGNKGQVTIASHEVLHPIFNSLIGGVKAQGAFVKDFKSKMTSKQKAYVNKELKARRYSKAETATELMNVFSDGIISNKINYDLTTFDKFKGAIANVFSNSDLGNISFDNGQDVYNFLKEYNTSVKTGKLSDAAIQAVKTAEKNKGVKVSDAKAIGGAQFSKSVAEAEAALDEAMDADPNNPSYLDNIDKAEAELDAAEEAAKNPQKVAPEVKKEVKSKPKVEKPKEPTRTTDLGPRDPLSQRIMDTYNVGMYGIERTEYRASNPLPAPLERKLVPMFEGYINTIVQQKFKQFATEALEFQDALSILRAEASSAIRTYNPAKNKDLAGYVKKIIQTRQSLMFKDANAQFAASLDDAKGVTATEDTQSIDRSGTVERGQATFDELDIVDDVLIEDIKQDLEKEIRVRVQKGTLSEMISVKKGRETYLVSWLENYVNKQLFKKLSKKLGAIGGVYPNAVIPGSYIDFLNDPKTFDIITKALPIKSIKKSYNKLFPVERVGREVTAEGNPVFKISKIKPKEFLTYFVKGNKSTVLERQKQLFREILEPLAKQVVADYVTPENLSELKSIQELAPAESVDVVNNMVLEAGLNNLESQIDRYKGEQKSFDIIQFSLSKDEKTEIADRLFLNNTSNLTMADLVSQIIGQTLKPLIAERKQAINDIEYKLGPELYAKVEETIIGPHLDSLLALKDKKSYQRGLFAEQLSWDAFKKVPGVKMVSKRPSGKSGSSAPDIVIKYNKETIIFEIKSNRSDRITSVNVHNYTNPAAYKTTRNTGAKSEKTIFNELKNSKNLNSFIAKVDKMMAKFYPEQKKYTDKNGAIELTPEQIDRLNLTQSLYKETSTEIKGLDENLVETIYNKKGANYIGFADIGTFYVGENKNNLKVPKFEVDLYTRSWLYKSVLKANGKHSFPLRMFAQISTASGKKLAESSNKSIINTESIKTVLQASKSTPDSLNNEFNDILEGATGFKSKSRVSDAASKMLGKTKGRFDFFIPPSAEDFAGLMYKLTGKSKKGEAQQAWFKKELFDPFAVAMRDFESYKENATAIVNSLKKSLKNIPSGLKDTNATGFTNEVAARVIMWRKNGYDIPGLAESEARALVKVVQNDPDLLAFVKQMDAALGKYPPPQNDWLAGTVTTDAINMINTTKRGEFLKDWQANADVIFSKENKQKMRAGLGDNYVEALEDMLYRMETGRNRPSGKNKQTNQFMNWVNDSVGTIMFFNTRSAVLQLLSTVNFINWGDNNPAMAAKAFANQDLFWKDFTKLFNSDFLKQRRSGLKNDVNADDIANAAATATNKTRAVLSSILKAGFLPTQMADSFAIALGGASFVRNRTNTYIQQGMDAKMAEEKAFLEFQEIAEETQQSSRPDRVSQQQASPLGRIVLAFANTPMQYMRLTKKAVLDLKNGRGDPKTNITKILYYAFVQNVIFSGLQAALFAAAFEDEDEDVIDNKQLNVANSMMDSVLRGTGVYGAIGSTLKNIVLETYKQSGKDRPDYVQSALRMLSISPPVDSKMRKVIGVGRAFSYKSVREKMKEPGIDNPALYAFGQTVSAIFNVPLDRAIRKASNVNAALDNDTKYWQKVALLLGWSQWDLGLIETSSSKKKKKKGFGTTTNWSKQGSWRKRGSWKK